jgi:uncharacterized protein (TIGR02646 family)
VIRVERERVPRPAVLDPDDPESPASRETERAIHHVENPAVHPKPKFSVYSHDEVKLALIELFRRKCAYCEASFLAATSGDIEHFRPKGRIDPGTGEEKIQPGYYWLAATWENLLLSCPGCNRSKRQLERTADGALRFTDQATGKIDLFPLADETRRVTSHEADLAAEESVRLLLDPCRDQPEEHLSFDIEGNVLPRELQGRVSERGRWSIRVYALDRWALKEARKQKYLDMVKCWGDIDLAAQMIEKLGPEAKDLVGASLRKNSEELRSFVSEEEEFAGMARCLLEQWLQELEGVEEKFRQKFGE